MERIFPFLGVRFIVINVNYDSLYSNSASDELIVPFKNLINEAYCRDTSVKIRSQLEVKRRRGDFIGSFAVFGYRKDPANHHRLLVDDYAADVVRDVFQWKMEGLSAGGIALRLNVSGIPTPMDYKQSQGMNYSTVFRIKEKSEWSAGMILRILKNPVYTGVLEQGRVTTPSYRVKWLVNKPREEWAIVENCHEAIIDEATFKTVQELAQQSKANFETMPGKGVADALKTPNLFKKLIYCADCGKAMSRRHVYSRTSEGRTYYYNYQCLTSQKAPDVCTPKNLKESELLPVVFATIRRHMDAITALEKRVLEEYTSVSGEKRRTLDRQIAQAKQEQSAVRPFWTACTRT